VVVFIYALVYNDVLPVFLGMVIYLACRQQMVLLETGGEESFFGYDFSQGYASLESHAPPRRRRSSFWQRWLQRRAARRVQRDVEVREAEERRLDELLAKIQREGRAALTAEEQRFLDRVSHRYRNRQ
jgi:hypothetical protein